ncbi:hypothetical protein B0H17DRAFT_1098846, partial [Mycena rosella]
MVNNIRNKSPKFPTTVGTERPGHDKRRRTKGRKVDGGVDAVLSPCAGFGNESRRSAWRHARLPDAP